MLQNYSSPITQVIYTNSDNSQVMVKYEDNTYNYASPTDQVVLRWINIDENTISAYIPPVTDPLRDTSQPGFVEPSEE